MKKWLIIMLLIPALLLGGCAEAAATELDAAVPEAPPAEPLLQSEDEEALQSDNDSDETCMSAEEQLGRELADFALDFLGSNYKYGGKTPEEGFDCSGLVYYVYSQFGYSLARVANDQAKQGVEVAPEELRAGDVLAFYKGKDYVGHVGIYIGGGYYLHAMGSAYGVVLTSLDDPYLQRVYTARRYIGCEELLTSSQQSGG